jgi:chemotaxis signal transduction protein
MIETSQTSAPARMLAYSSEASAAFPEHCAVALIEAPTVFDVPGAPAHCAGLIEWAGDLVPLIDLKALADGARAGDGGVPTHALVIAWQPAPREELQFGAVYAPELVAAIRVSDTQSRAAPDGHALARVAAAFFESEGRVVPIVDALRLFGTPA